MRGGGSKQSRFHEPCRRRFWPLLCFLALFLLDFGFRAIYQDFGGTPLFAAAPLLFTLGWSLILTAAAALLPGTARRIFLMAAALLFALQALAHGILLNIFNRFFLLSDLAFVGDGAAFADLSYLELPKKAVLLAILSVLLMAVAAYLTPARSDRRRARVFSAFAAFVIGASVVAAVHHGQMRDGEQVNWENTASAYRDFTDTKQCLTRMGLYQYFFRDLWRTVVPASVKREALRAELEEALSSLPPPKENSYTGRFAGYNLILVQLEAIDTWMLTEETMPNLYSLQRRSVDFVNHFTPAYITGGTFNTEFIVNTGLIPPSAGVSAGVYAGNAYPFALPALFRQAGYTANSFHGSPSTVYNRSAVHPAWGYEAYHSGLEMGMEDYTMDSQMIAGFERMTQNAPFFSFLITYSGHGPYRDGTSAGVHLAEMKTLYPEADEVYQRAMAHARETDLFVGSLLERLAAARLDESTVLVFYSDHYNYYVMNDELVMGYKDAPDLNLLQRTPFFLFAPGLAPAVVEKVTSSVDLFPTLLNLFGLSPGGAYLPGADVFGDGGGFVFFADRTFYDGVTYSAWGVEDDGYARRMDAEIAARFELSRDILASDYYGRKE